MQNFDFEEEKIIAEISKHNAKCVLLQLPEGLKSEGLRLVKIIEKMGVLSLISGDPCYGACDIIKNDLNQFSIDLIFHFGHSRMLKNQTKPIIYLDVKSKIKIDKTISESFIFLKKYKKIGLVTTIQHIHAIKTASDLLLAAGKSVLIGKSKTLPYSGQIIGCEYSAAKSIAHEVDAFLFIGGGRFHAIGVALSTNKPTILANPFDQKVINLEDQTNKLLQQHWIFIQKAKNAKNFGVLVGLKPGQEDYKNALKIKKVIEKNKKFAVIILINEITPEALMAFPSIDVYINTACPRISFEAPMKFIKPVLTINEFKVLSGEYSWKELINQGLFENQS